MAWLLKRNPQIHATFNFVPALIEQLRAYVEGGEEDHYEQLSRKPADQLSSSERTLLIRYFFSISQETGIQPRARYGQLYQRREQPDSFSVQDLRDLQLLFNLAWFGFAARAEYPLLEELEHKGQRFTEEEKQALLDLQREVMARTLPLYRELITRGQVEVTATPYHHPILPLIIDTETMRRCQPEAKRPPRFSWEEDARVQVERALDAHEAAFGARPRGMWPAEGAVSPEAAALFVQSGVEWIATDEAQLWNSLGGEQPRSKLFSAHQLQVGEARLDLVFRDRGISDLIGFSYGHNSAELAVDDLMEHLHTIRESDSAAEFLLIALDGENPWEHYPESGRPFLERLYQHLAADPLIETQCISDYLDQAPARPLLPKLHSGSWINGDYGIWIGGEMENRAWQYLGEARTFFEEQRQTQTEERLEQAYELLLQAEGSDWFWWYGEPFSSDHDADFDQLFRARLRQVYQLLGGESPPGLERSLYPQKSDVEARTPRAFITPRFKGRSSSYLDWVGAGVHDLVAPHSSMYQGSRRFGRLRYGFDLERLYLRLEPIPDEPLPDLRGLSLRLRLYSGARAVAEFSLGATQGELRFEAQRSPRSLNLFRVQQGIIELGLPFAALGLLKDERLRFSLHLLRGGLELERFPAMEELEVRVPCKDFEERNWSA